MSSTNTTNNNNNNNDDNDNKQVMKCNQLIYTFFQQFLYDQSLLIITMMNIKIAQQIIVSLIIMKQLRNI